MEIFPTPGNDRVELPHPRHTHPGVTKFNNWSPFDLKELSFRSIIAVKLFGKGGIKDMERFTHSPGPLTVKASEQTGVQIITEAPRGSPEITTNLGECVIARVFGDGPVGSKNANAALFAKSPDMLALLRELLVYLMSNSDQTNPEKSAAHRELIVRLTYTIQKAEGS